MISSGTFATMSRDMNHEHDDKTPVALSLEEIKHLAAAVANDLKSLGNGPMPLDLRNRFINVRAALFQRGIYDPVLVRFDSATVPQATTAELAEQLASVAAGL